MSAHLALGLVFGVIAVLIVVEAVREVLADEREAKRRRQEHDRK